MTFRKVRGGFRRGLALVPRRLHNRASREDAARRKTAWKKAIIPRRDISRDRQRCAAIGQVRARELCFKV